MFKQILDMLPPDPSGTVVTCIVAIGIGLGALTCLLGALHSRLTMTLFMLVLGALLGCQLPRHFQWHVNVSVVTAIAAIVSGLAGYAMHRICVATLLALLICTASLYVFHDQIQPANANQTPAVQLGVPASQTLTQTWESAPPVFRKYAIWIAPAILIATWLLGYLFPRFGMASLYGFGGTLLTLGFIRLGHASSQITWLDSLKTGPMTTATLGFCMLLLGFMTQMVLLFRQADAPQQPAPELASAL